MRRLLSANWAYVWRSKYFWAGGIAMAAWAAFDCFTVRKDINTGHIANLDGSMLRGGLILMIVLPAVCGLVVGVDYHDGVIRNKLLAGRRRAPVYLSNLFTVYLVGLCYLAGYVALCSLLSIGIPLENLSSVVVRLGLCLLISLSMSAMATLVAMLVTGRMALVACTLLGIGLLFGSHAINGILQASPASIDWEQIKDVYSTLEGDEYYNHFIGWDGEEIPEDQVPKTENPNYIREPLRTVMRKFNDAQPGGQMFELLQRGHGWFDEMQVYHTAETPYWQLALWAVLMTAVFTAAGLLAFQRKDIK